MITLACILVLPSTIAVLIMYGVRAAGVWFAYLLGTVALVSYLTSLLVPR